MATAGPSSPAIVEPLIEYSLSVVMFQGPALPTSFTQAVHLLLLALSILQPAAAPTRSSGAGPPRPFRMQAVQPTGANRGWASAAPGSGSLGDGGRHSIAGPRAALTQPPQPVARSGSGSSATSSSTTSLSDTVNELKLGARHRRSQSLASLPLPAGEPAGRYSLDSRIGGDASARNSAAAALDPALRDRLTARAVQALATGLHMRNCVTAPLALWRRVLARQMALARDALAPAALEARAHICALVTVKLFMLSERGAEELARCADSSTAGDGHWRTTFGKGRPARIGVYMQPVVPRATDKERRQLHVRHCFCLMGSR